MLMRREKKLTCYRNCEPLTPDDIAEIIVFSAGRRENVVIADTLVFPSHQVSFARENEDQMKLTVDRHLPLRCTKEVKH